MNNTHRRTRWSRRSQMNVSNDACAKNYGVDIWNLYNDIFYRNNLKAIFTMYSVHTSATGTARSKDEKRKRKKIWTKRRNEKKNGNKSGLIGPIHGVNWSRHAYTIHASILCVCIYSPLSCVRYSFYGTIEKSPLGWSDIVNGVRATVVIVVDTYIILYRITNGRKTTV